MREWRRSTNLEPRTFGSLRSSPKHRVLERRESSARESRFANTNEVDRDARAFECDFPTRRVRIPYSTEFENRFLECDSPLIDEAHRVLRQLKLIRKIFASEFESRRETFHFEMLLAHRRASVHHSATIRTRARTRRFFLHQSPKSEKNLCTQY